MPKDPPKTFPDDAETMSLLRRSLKLLLYRLASRSETPSSDLERILQEVITELYNEAQAALQEKRNRLRLLPGGIEPDGALSASSP